jgi:hypothetical protein
METYHGAVEAQNSQWRHGVSLSKRLHFRISLMSYQFRIRIKVKGTVLSGSASELMRISTPACGLSNPYVSVAIGFQFDRRNFYF